jgi:hypothetical protein
MIHAACIGSHGKRVYDRPLLRFVCIYKEY